MVGSLTVLLHCLHLYSHYKTLSLILVHEPTNFNRQVILIGCISHKHIFRAHISRDQDGQQTLPLRERCKALELQVVNLTTERDTLKYVFSEWYVLSLFLRAFIHTCLTSRAFIRTYLIIVSIHSHLF